MLLTIINNIPLWSLEWEALAWGKSRGIDGFHTHMYYPTGLIPFRIDDIEKDPVIGYMGGFTHITSMTSFQQTESPEALESVVEEGVDSENIQGQNINNPLLQTQATQLTEEQFTQNIINETVQTNIVIGQPLNQSDNAVVQDLENQTEPIIERRVIPTQRSTQNY